MCGIAGYFSLSGERGPGRPVLERMVAAVRHRGPDGAGLHCEHGIGLGHRRLSILDLAGGAQPFADPGGEVWLTFNGEIFNYVELRRELEARGQRLRTHSDTEVLLAQYLESGERCLEAFNGDFAFALWDRRAGSLLLARDRMGVRPLYYTVVSDTLVFASEVKALLEFPGVRAELDPVALEQCFTFWFPLAPRTPFRGIRELPPGHRLVARRGGLETRAYWQPAFPPAEEARGDRRSEAEVAEALEALLADATRIRLRADVPVGAYLSGGFDSSATAALARDASGARLRTFSVGFESPDYDETPFQEAMVRALGTEHSALPVTAGDIGRVFPAVVRHVERPVLRTAPAPLYALSRLVRDSGYKVVVTGEGADEVFGGYDIFKEAQVRRFWGRRPQSAWRHGLLRRLYPYLSGVQAQPPAYLRAFFAEGLERRDDPLFSHLPRFATTRRLRRFYAPELLESLAGYDALEDLRGRLPPDFRRWHPLAQAQYLEMAYLLPGYILSSQGDRVSMAHAVEGRFPFLDPRVVEFAAAIPPRMKLRGLREKHILRRALAGRVPSLIGARPKQPYRAPESPCFFGADAAGYAREALDEAAVRRAGWFSPAAVRRLVDKCVAGRATGASDNMALVGILSTQLLHGQFQDGDLKGLSPAEDPCHTAALS